MAQDDPGYATRGEVSKELAHGHDGCLVEDAVESEHRQLTLSYRGLEYPP